MGSTYETRQEYGILFYPYKPGTGAGEFFYGAGSLEEIKEYGEEQYPNVNFDEAIKDLVDWTIDFGLSPMWLP